MASFRIDELKATVAVLLTVCVVAIVAPCGIPRDLFRSWTSEILQRAARPTREIEAAEPINAVVVCKCGGFVQQGGSILWSYFSSRLLTL